jgi:hypothetical protein
MKEANPAAMARKAKLPSQVTKSAHVAAQLQQQDSVIVDAVASALIPGRLQA